MSLRLMILDDNPDDRLLVRHELEKVFPGLTAIEPTNDEALRAALVEEEFDLVVTDFRLGWTDGLKVLAAAKAACPGCPVVMFTGTGSEEVAVEGMKAGLDDYVVKSPAHYVRLAFAVRSALERAETKREAARLSAALHEAEERSRVIVEGVQDYAIFMVTPDGRIGSWNPGAGRLLGYSEAEILGRPFSTLFVPEDVRAGEPDEELREAAEQGRSARDGWRERKGGGRIWVSGVLSALPDEAGGLRGFAKVMRDLTDRKRMEDTLRDQKERLAEADRKKDEFLATLAHELRNPLAPIRMGLEVLRLSKGDPATADEMLGTMERQVVLMVRLIEDLLDVSRITRGKLELRKTRVELRDVLKSAVEAARPLIAEAGHRLTITLPEQAVVLDADPARLSQVFSNLLNNAAKYTKGEGRIDLAAAVEGGLVAVSIRDTGIGIPPDKLEAVFEMFTQVNRTFERSHGGLGIGLTLVRSLVEMHDGSVTASSGGPGRGSEFVVRLPLAGTPGVEDGGREVEGRTTAAPAPVKVLVVDDNRDAADSLATVLRALGHEVATAYDGEAALEAAERFRPEVALLDLGMPGMSGYDAARRLRDRPWGSGVSIVALTGWGQEEDRRRTRQAGFDRHLVKPVEPAVLQQLLASVRPGGG